MKTLLPFRLVFLLTALNLVSRAEALTWQQAVDRAGKENPEIAAAKEQLRASHQKRWAAMAGFLPQVKATVSYDDSLSNGGATTLSTSTSGSSRWSAALTGNWNLFSGFQDEAKWRQATADEAANEAATAIAVAKISSELRTGFESAAYARDFLKLTQQILKRREENLRLVQLRFESGRENKGSLLLSEAYLEQAKLDNLQAENGQRTASAQLAKTLGIDGTLEKLEAEGNTPIQDPPTTLPNFESLAQRTPEYLQSTQQSESAHQAQHVARASFMPSLDLSSSITRRDDDFFPKDREISSVGVTLTLPLFSGGRDDRTWRAAIATESAARYTRENTLREARRKLEAAWAAYVESAAKLRADESFRKAAVVRSDIARTKYNNGLLSFEDWDLIENDLINRQKALLQSRRDRTTAEASWEQAQGKGIWP